MMKAIPPTSRARVQLALMLVLAAGCLLNMVLLFARL